MGRIFKGMAGGVALLIGGYFLAALVGSLWPTNRNWTQVAQGTTIYLHDNGIHTSLILPRGHPDLDPGMLFVDFADRAPDTSSQPNFLHPGFPGSPRQYPFLAVGWGDREFFLNTPGWADVRPSTAMTAIFGSGATLIHVDRLAGIPPGEVRKLTLRRAEYQAILTFVSSQLAQDHAARHIVRPGYGADDRFYATDSRYAYSGVFTCNNWIATGLAQAGVRIGRWTPFSGGVMWWF